jgi:hypothetical protein
MTEHGPYFWDSCILVSHLKNEKSSMDLSIVKDYLNQASEGKCEIFISTLSRVEIIPNLDPMPSSLGEINEIWKEVEGTVTVVSPNPEVIRYATMLRCVPYARTGGKRNLGTGDSILLATALFLQDMGTDLKYFHTNDKGKSKNLDGSKNVPLIGYAEWVVESLESLEDELRCVVERICALTISQPQHLAVSQSLGLVQGNLLELISTKNTTISADGETHDEESSQLVTKPAEEANQDPETQMEVLSRFTHNSPSTIS